MLLRWGLLICQIVCLGVGGVAATGAAKDILHADAAVSARQSVQTSPADAYLWADLAWAEQVRGEHAAALRALTRSWHLAPHSRNLSLYRAQLGARHWPVLTPEQRAHLLRDMEQAPYRARRMFRVARAHDPRFAAVWRAAHRHASLQKGPIQ